MIITSLNLVAASEKNWEMGIWIDRNNDREIFDTAERDVQTIFNDSILLTDKPFSDHVFKSPTNHKRTTSSKGGYCIRCEKNIPFDVSKPFCHSCFSKWMNGWMTNTLKNIVIFPVNPLKTKQVMQNLF